MSVQFLCILFASAVTIQFDKRVNDLKISYSNLSNYMAYANGADPDQTFREQSD